MKLRELCSEFKYECLSGSMDVDVRDVIYDSRKITEGTVFVCMVGAVTDGHKYIPDAVKKGASAIVVERADEAQQIPDQVTVIQVESARRAMPTCRRRCSDIRTVSWSRSALQVQREKRRRPT